MANTVGVDSGQLYREVKDPLAVTDGNDDRADGAVGLTAANATNSSCVSMFACLCLAGLI